MCIPIGVKSYDESVVSTSVWKITGLKLDKVIIKLYHPDIGAVI